MKTLLKTLLGGFTIMLAFSSCQSTETVPFDAAFTGIYTAVFVDSVTCGPAPSIHVIVDCTGECKTLGNFTTHFDFCADEEGYYPGPRMIAHASAANPPKACTTVEPAKS